MSPRVWRREKWIFGGRQKPHKSVTRAVHLLRSGSGDLQCVHDSLQAWNRREGVVCKHWACGLAFLQGLTALDHHYHLIPPHVVPGREAGTLQTGICKISHVDVQPFGEWYNPAKGYLSPEVSVNIPPCYVQIWGVLWGDLRFSLPAKLSQCSDRLCPSMAPGSSLHASDRPRNERNPSAWEGPHCPYELQTQAEGTLLISRDLGSASAAWLLIPGEKTPYPLRVTLLGLWGE